jgi:zinc protease
MHMHAQTTVTPSTPRGLAPVKRVLDNGATIIAKESRATPAVTLHASVRAGTIYDPIDLPGLAHFVSRTIDRGTVTHTGDQIAEVLDTRGVSLTVSVNRHAMSLVCTCLVEDYDVVVGLLAEIMQSAAFQQDQIEIRRGEIITMIRQDEDNPATVAAEALMALLYGDHHPYGRPTRGTLGAVQRIDRNALQAFHAARFRPEHLSLVVVGDVPCSTAVDVAGRALASWRGSDGQPPSVDLASVPLPSEGGRRVRVLPMMNKAQADIAYGFRSITRDDPAFFAYTLMNNILGQYSLGGRLGDSIRERQGMAYYVFSGFDASVIPGPLMVRAGVAAENVARAVASIDEELGRMAAEGPTDEELAESRQYLIGSMPRNLETNTGIASYLQLIEFFGLGLDYDLRVPDLLRAVTREDVHAAARRTLDPARAAVVVAGPFDGPLA